MTLSRKDFVRLTVVAVGGASLASLLPGCGGTSSDADAGTGGGSGGGTGGGSGGGTGGGSGGGTGGGSGGGTGGGGGSDAGTGGGAGGGGGADAGTGGGTGGGGSASTCATNGAHDSAISLNHGHALLVPAADFQATGSKTYDITGTSLHSHSITLSEAQRATLLGGGTVMVTSTIGNAHTHVVTVACA
jgi:hypothetical protein